MEFVPTQRIPTTIDEVVGMNIANVNIDAVLKMVGAKMARIIHPMGFYTQDYRLDRINIAVDEHGLVQRLWIG